MKIFNTRSIRKAAPLFAALLLLVVMPAQADTLGDLAENIQGQFGGITNAITGALMMIGIVIGGIAALKFKAHNENPQQVKIGTPLTLMLVAALLIGLPAYLNMTKETVLGSGAAGGSVDGSVYGQIGGN